jgi:hypothetical protein
LDKRVNGRVHEARGRLDPASLPENDKQVTERRPNLGHSRTARRWTRTAWEVLANEVINEALVNTRYRVSPAPKPTVKVLDTLHVLLNR